MGLSSSTDSAVATYARDLADKFADQVGWLPTTTYQAAADKGRIITAAENDEPCGFLHRGPYRRETKIYQAIVQLDARRILHATRLFRRLEEEAIAKGVNEISLWCASDLESNLFWLSLGAEPTTTRIKRTKRRRPHQGYRFILPAGLEQRRKNAQDRRYQQGEKLLEMFGPIHKNDRGKARILRALEP